MAWKLIELKALKPFFFGRHKVFTNTHYAVSEYFPQQTQIMGALRLYWMEQNKLMRVHKDGKYVPYEKRNYALNLVGDASSGNHKNFDINENLGCINGISPMFVLKKEEDCIKDALFEIPSDIVNKDCANTIAIPKVLQGIVSDKPAVLLGDYDVKEGFVSGLAGADFWREYIDYKASDFIYGHDDVFESYEQVGIGLENKQVVEGQFYTKKSYKLKDDHSFGLLIDIDDNKLKKLDDKNDTKKKHEYRLLANGIISMGADSSMFSLHISDIPSCINAHPLIQNIQCKTEEQGTKIILLSDSILDESIDVNAFFQIVQGKVPFKMMSSDKEDLRKDDSTAQRVKISDTKSSEKLLVPKGSVYYFKSKSQLQEAKCAYAKMGFNHYLTLN